MTIAFEELRPERPPDERLFPGSAGIGCSSRPGHVEDNMTWGGLPGVLWHQDVSFVFVRPVGGPTGSWRSTPVYTLSFFDEEHRGALQLYGSRSGAGHRQDPRRGADPLPDAGERDGLHPGALGAGCRKLHSQDLDPSRFLDPSILGNYPDRDFHRLLHRRNPVCLTR